MAFFISCRSKVGHEQNSEERKPQYPKGGENDKSYVWLKGSEILLEERITASVNMLPC